MNITILVPTALQSFTGNEDSIAVEGKTVDEALCALTQKHPHIKKHLFNDKGELRSFVNIYVNDEDIRYQNQHKTPLNQGDTLTIVPSIAGGSNLSNDEIKRYSRHLILPEVGREGQEKLKAAKVLCVGSGGLGSPMSLYLTAAGVGTIGMVDFDVVDFSNLQRQILFGTSDVGKSKVATAQKRLTDLNPNCNIVAHETKLTAENAMEIVKQYDIVADGTDNFPTRYLVNDACVLLGKPNVYGSIFRFEGQASVFDSKRGPCYRCLYSEPPPPGLVPSCAEGGVLGILPGIVGVIQATEVVKLILGKGTTLIGRLLTFNALKMTFRELKLRKNPECPICGENPTIKALIDYEQFCGIGIGQESVGEAAAKANEGDNNLEIEPEELKKQLENKEVTLIDVREPQEYDICHIDGSKLIPLGEIEARKNELNANEKIVLHCHHGGRSMQALQVLQAAGFKNLQNLTGGIDAWAEKIQPNMARY